MPPQGAPGGSERFGAPRGNTGSLGAQPLPRFLEPAAHVPAFAIQVLPTGLQAALALREENMELDERHHDAGMAACHACDAWERAHVLLSAVALRRGALLPETYELGMELFEAAGECQHQPQPQPQP